MIEKTTLKDYLVILAGSPRGGEATWKSLYKNVLDELDADLAMFWSEDWDKKISLYSRAKYKWIFDEPEDFNSYYEKRFSGNWKEYFETGIETGLYSSGLIHFVFKDMIKEQYLDVINEYKYIIYTRFDQYYLNKHPRVQDPYIYIPEGEDFFGLCDRHAIFPSSYATEFFNICSFIDSKDSLNNVPAFNNCETTFLSHLQSNGLVRKVKRFSRVQFTSTLKGEHTNWRIAKYKLYFYKNLMIKYPDEFIDGVRNCIDEYSILKYFLKKPFITLNYILLVILRKIGKFKSNEDELYEW